MLRPYVIDRDLPNLPNLHDLLRLLRSVSGILCQQRVRVHLVLRNRQQHAERRTRRLVPPRLGVLAVPDQILAPLGFAGELEPALLEDKVARSEEHTSELQSPCNLVCRLLLEKKNIYTAYCGAL